MRPTAGLLISTILLASTPSITAAQRADATAPIVAGWIERVSLPRRALVFDAKLDTGADSSSINARGIREIAGGSRPLVKFQVSDDADRSVEIEAPVVRRARIKRSGAKTDERLVVRLTVCVGGKDVDAHFTLADRADLKYQMLIGRNVLAGRILVDSGRQRLVSDRCRRKH